MCMLRCLFLRSVTIVPCSLSPIQRVGAWELDHQLQEWSRVVKMLKPGSLASCMVAANAGWPYFIVSR